MIPDAPGTQPVVAVVVTYHPEPDVADHLALLRPQVSRLVVVDNGSDAAAIVMLHDAAARLDFELILNGENLGIATALNIGVHKAVELGAEWLLLFDQDSCVTGQFTESMMACHDRLFATQRLGLLVPRYIDRRTRQPLPELTLKDGSLAIAMTSGTFMSVATFKACGDFADELFIDSVDHEYSLRVRRVGYKIAVCESAVLLHSPATPRAHSLFGLVQFQSSNYSPLRRYYQERNKIWMYRRYGNVFPGFCARQAFRSVVDLTKVLLVESDKLAKCRLAMRGIYDGFRGRMGRL